MKKLGFFLALIVALGLGSLGGAAWFFGYFEVAGEPLVVVVQKGENFLQIAPRLVDQGVVRDARALRWYLNLFGARKRLQRGEFELRRNMSIPAAITALSEGKPIEHKFTVPEGHNIFQIAQALEDRGLGKKTDFLAAARAPEVLARVPTGEGARSIEGYIFPDTYLIQRVFSEVEIAQMMVARFREVWGRLRPAVEASAVVKELGLTPHQVVTLASIVEKETGAAVERPLIASVFVNRMRKRMRLQTDPTVIYGVWDRDGVFDGNIRRRDLQTHTDFNTYMIPGLPPGPIASPGENSIQAVLSPAESEFLFFVSRNDGTHVFTSDFRAHSRAVTDLQKARGAREGKSWRNLPEGERAK